MTVKCKGCGEKHPVTRETYKCSSCGYEGRTADDEEAPEMRDPTRTPAPPEDRA